MPESFPLQWPEGLPGVLPLPEQIHCNDPKCPFANVKHYHAKESDPVPPTIVITGASRGLGLEIARAMKPLAGVIFNLSLELGKEPVEGTRFIYCDVRSKQSVQSARDEIVKQALAESFPVPSILINNAGVNEISWLENMFEADWNRVMDTNAKGIFLMARAFLPDLALKQGTILNIVSNAAHIPMTGSLAYNASKAAAHIMTRQLAHELTRKYNITVFGVAPNKLRGTGMSTYIESRVPEERGWTPEYAREYQLKALLTGEETEPKAVAEFIAFLLSMKSRHVALSGCILPYGV